jgi:alcohol dehydrogenase
MVPFDLQCRTRVVFGPGTIARLGEFAGELGTRRALVVTDPGIVAAGHTRHGIDSLVAAGIETHVFDHVHENPSTDNVEQGLAAAKRYEPELIVGIGGGSSMDCAKGINFLYSNGGSMRDYHGVGKALKEMLPMIAVPTTAGTGSETQSFALISDSTTHVKMACGDKKASFRVAILDPELTVTQPAAVTALTGIDALAHALETYVTTKRNPASIAFSREAWRLLATNFAVVLSEPGNLHARGGMQLGACFAGMAIENSMLGATHALANPLTAHYGIAHGQAIGLMLPHVIRFNGREFASWYEELVRVTMGEPGMPKLEASVDGLAIYVANLAAKANLRTKLSACGVDAAKLPQLAEDAAKQWTGTFNPRKVGPAEFLRLYQAAF